MKKVLLGMLVLGAMASCKKDKKNCDLNSSNIVGSYKVTASTYKADSATATVDEFATWEACEKDDITILNANNTVTYTDAGTTCTPSTNDTGIWALIGDQINTDGAVGTVTSFDCSGMTITYAGTTTGELTTVTLVKQ